MKTKANCECMPKPNETHGTDIFYSAHFIKIMAQAHTFACILKRRVKPNPFVYMVTHYAVCADKTKHPI